MTTVQGLRLRYERIGPSLRRFVCFCVVGFSGVFVDMGVLYLLSDPTTLQIPFQIGKALAVETAIINNFIWNETWTFGDVAVSRSNAWDRIQRFIRFNVVCLAGLVIGLSILWFLHGVHQVNIYTANIVAILGATGWNYTLNTRFNWTVSKIATGT